MVARLRTEIAEKVPPPPAHQLKGRTKRLINVQRFTRLKHKTVPSRRTANVQLRTGRGRPVPRSRPPPQLLSHPKNPLNREKEHTNLKIQENGIIEKNEHMLSTSHDVSAVETLPTDRFLPEQMIKDATHEAYREGQRLTTGRATGLPRGVPRGRTTRLTTGLTTRLTTRLTTGVPRGVPRGIPRGVPRGYLPRGIPRGIPRGLPRGVPRGIPRGVPREILQQAEQKSPLDVIADRGEKEISEKSASEAIERKPKPTVIEHTQPKNETTVSQLNSTTTVKLEAVMTGPDSLVQNIAQNEPTKSTKLSTPHPSPKPAKRINGCISKRENTGSTKRLPPQSARGPPRGLPPRAARGPPKGYHHDQHVDHQEGCHHDQHVDHQEGTTTSSTWTTKRAATTSDHVDHQEGCHHEQHVDHQGAAPPRGPPRGPPTSRRGTTNEQHVGRGPPRGFLHRIQKREVDTTTQSYDK